MDNLFVMRLIRLFLYFSIGAFFGGYAAFSFAETIPATGGFTTNGVSATSPYDTTCDTAIRAAAQSKIGLSAKTEILLESDVNAAMPSSISCGSGAIKQSVNLTTGSRVRVIYKHSAASYTQEVYLHYEGSNSCPSGQNWTLSGTNCTRPDCSGGETRDPLTGICLTPCPAGYDRNASGQCVKDCTGKAGMPTVNGSYEFEGAVSNWSVGNCKVNCKQRVLASQGGAGYSCSFTGASAQPDNPEAVPLPPDPTKLPPESPKDCTNKGQGYITTSSGITCVPQEDAPEGQKPEKQEEDRSKESGKPGPDGKPDPNADDYKKEESKISSGGGSTKVEKKETENGKPDGNGGMTCSAGFTLNADGKTCSKTTVTEESTGSFCKDNPDAKVCKSNEEAKESTFGGGCDTGFVCSGDAATCAIAKASYETRCFFQPDETTGLYDKANPGGTPGQIAAANSALNADGSKDFNFAEKWGIYKQAYLNYVSACPVGLQTFTVGRAVIEIDGTIVCDIGRVVRVLIHMFAYLGVLRLFSAKLV